ncbi:MAG TPA: hypothetical protein VFI45_20370 [Candidatus Acidoferrum sp.]|nr:hypothetical protein [Candidatus Acidoferrum sp.]
MLLHWMQTRWSTGDAGAASGRFGSPAGLLWEASILAAFYHGGKQGSRKDRDGIPKIAPGISMIR